MPLVLANRVQETGTANTTVSFTLTGAVSGFQTFAVIGNTNTTYYSATDPSGNWEVGLGTYSTTGPTLTRTTVYASSNSNLAVTFSGAVNVFVTYPSGRSVNLDGSGNVSALGTVSSGTWQGTTVGVAYGGTGVTTSSGPNSVVLRDANENITVNRLSQGLQTITASGGVTTLTAASDFNQQLVGTGGHTFRLPDATTLTDTTTFQFNNNATGTLTIQNNAATTVGAVAPGGAAGIALMDNSTSGGTWDVHGYIPENVIWGTNSLYLASDVITGGTWQGGTIQSAYGGTGLTTFTGANNALYSTSASNLVAGTLPAAAGGTGLTSYTINGVVYASGTGTLATGSALTFNGTNLGISGAPSAWGSSYRVLQIGQSAFFSTSNFAALSQNLLVGPSSNTYIANGPASYYSQLNGAHTWFNAPSGLAGNSATTVQAMSLSASGDLTLGSIASPGTFTISSGTANGVAYLNGSKVLTTGSGLTYNGTTLTADTASTSAANFRIENGSFNRVGAFQLTANGVQFDAFDQSSTSTQRSFMWLSGGSEQMRLTSTGLGIGTSSPSTYSVAPNLVVASSGGGGMTVRTNSTYGGVYFADGVTGDEQYRGYVQYNHNLSGLTDALIFGTAGTGKMTLDSSGNLGIGVTPSAWGVGNAIELGQVTGNAMWGIGINSLYLVSNARWNGSNYVYTNNGAANLYANGGGSGVHAWFNAPSGTAGNGVSFTQAMTLDASGNLLVGSLSGSGDRIYASGYIRASSGFKTDGTTWIDSPASETMRFVTNNTERARISSAGNFSMAAAGAITGSRINPRTSTTTSTATLTPDIQAADQYNLTAQSVGLTIDAPIGSPVDGNRLTFRIIDNGTGQTITWNATYTAIGVTLPTSTTANKMVYVGCVYNSTNARWDVVAVTTQA